MGGYSCANTGQRTALPSLLTKSAFYGCRVSCIRNHRVRCIRPQCSVFLPDHVEAAARTAACRRSTDVACFVLEGLARVRGESIDHTGFLIPPETPTGASVLVNPGSTGTYKG